MSTDPMDDEPEPTEEELRAAAELARALDAKGDPAPGSDAAYASALRATRGMGAKLEPAEASRAVERALARGARGARTRGRVRWLAVAAAALFAVAIPVGLAMQHRDASGGTTTTTPPRVLSFGGPTDAIFGAPFEDGQRPSERMDRIANVRAHDYFAALAGAEAR